MRLITLASIIFALVACAPVAPGSLRPSTAAPATVTPVILASPVAPTATAPVLPSPAPVVLCVTAVKAVWMRTKPVETSAPILAIRTGAEVVILAGGAWSFVRYEGRAGYVNSDYLGGCK